MNRATAVIQIAKSVSFQIRTFGLAMASSPADLSYTEDDAVEEIEMTPAQLYKKLKEVSPNRISSIHLKGDYFDRLAGVVERKIRPRPTGTSE